MHESWPAKLKGDGWGCEASFIFSQDAKIMISPNSVPPFSLPFLQLASELTAFS